MALELWRSAGGPIGDAKLYNLFLANLIDQSRPIYCGDMPPPLIRWRVKRTGAYGTINHKVHAACDIFIRNYSANWTADTHKKNKHLHLIESKANTRERFDGDAEYTIFGFVYRLGAPCSFDLEQIDRNSFGGSKAPDLEHDE